MTGSQQEDCNSVSSSSFPSLEGQRQRRNLGQMPPLTVLTSLIFFSLGDVVLVELNLQALSRLFPTHPVG